MANSFFVEPANPLQVLMSGVQGYDRGQKSLQQQAMQEAGQLYASGNQQGAIARLLQIGKIQDAGALSGLGQQDWERGFKERQFGENVRQFNLGVEGQKVEPGFRKTATGLEPIPGGSKDPAYIQETRKGPQMSVSDITKLSEEGGKFSSLGSFLTSFKPEFAGAVPGLGDARNWVGRTLPEAMTTPEAREGSSWWQNYDKYKNVVRHDLFGSALTATEQAQWERADIRNTMQPEQIRKNLQTQQEIVQKGLVRKASALVQAGHDPRVIASAYGVSLESLGVPTKRGQGGDALSKARAAIASGAPREAVIQRLRENGIDSSGL